MSDNRYYWKLRNDTEHRWVGEPVAAETITEAYDKFNKLSVTLSREDAMNPSHRYSIIKLQRNTYAWMITKDHLWEDSHLPKDSLDPDEQPEVGQMGPRDMSPEHDEMLHLYLSQLQNGIVPKRLEGQKTFKMYDDDGILYYTGIAIGNFSGEEPLVDFGTPNAGCTLIKWLRYPEMNAG